MPSQEDVVELVGHIYEAAADEQRWPAFLEKLAEAVSATATTLSYHDLTAPRATFLTSARCDPETVGQYMEYYGSLDVHRAAWFTRYSRAGPETIYTSEQVIPQNELEKTEYFNDFTLVHDIVHHLGAPIVVTAPWASCVACHRPPSMKPFGPEEVRLLQHLWPHLQRAMQFHRRFAELEGQQRASLDALDRLSTAVLLLDHAGRIMLANREARRILEQNDGLFPGKLELAAARPEQNRELRRATADASLQSGTVDASDTASTYITVLTPGASYTTASGVDYAAVPEPGSLFLLAAALLGIWFGTRRRGEGQPRPLRQR